MPGGRRRVRGGPIRNSAASSFSPTADPRIMGSRTTAQAFAKNFSAALQERAPDLAAASDSQTVERPRRGGARRSRHVRLLSDGDRARGQHHRGYRRAALDFAGEEFWGIPDGLIAMARPRSARRQEFLRPRWHPNRAIGWPLRFASGVLGLCSVRVPLLLLISIIMVA